MRGLIVLCLVAIATAKPSGGYNYQQPASSYQNYQQQQPSYSAPEQHYGSQQQYHAAPAPAPAPAYHGHASDAAHYQPENKPQVHFVKYNTEDEINQFKSQIIAHLDSLPGPPTQVHDLGPAKLIVIGENDQQHLRETYPGYGQKQQQGFGGEYSQQQQGFGGAYSQQQQGFGGAYPQQGGFSGQAQSVGQFPLSHANDAVSSSYLPPHH